MPVEIVGQQLRIRMYNPDVFTKFKTQDVGRKGRLQRVVGYSRKTGWQTQSWRLNLADYSNVNEVVRQIKNLKIPSSKKNEAISLVRRSNLI